MKWPIRVFPRRTKATPVDPLAFVGEPPLWLPYDVDEREIHVSCTFSWDKSEAQRLAAAWQFRLPEATVRVGGPAYGDAGDDFWPGLYLASGYTITSRGCPNRCDKCLVPVREGRLRTLPIVDGWNVLDNNLLACPEGHIADVLAMLRRQPCRPQFTGGLESRRMTPDVTRELLSVRPSMLYLAYDRPADYEPLAAAVAMIHRASGWAAGRMRHHVGCYVLVGTDGDTVESAEYRIDQVRRLNVRAFPMYYRGPHDPASKPREWADLIGGVVTMGAGR